MEDLREVLVRNRALYRKYHEAMPCIEEFIMGYRWLMAADKQNRISLALRVGEEESAREQTAVLKSFLDRPSDEVLEELINENDHKKRTIAVALSNLMSKPFNTAERLADRGIIRTEGQKFPYDVKGKKVGIIGYGLYNNFFLGKCAEFHAFDFRKEKDLLSIRIGKEETVYPTQIHWHLGENALEHIDLLETLDIVIMTGCTIVNDTYRGILNACRNAEIRGIYGPSSELCPEYLFDLGYNYIFSASVRDKDEYLNATFDALPKGNDLSYMNIYELTRRA